MRPPLPLSSSRAVEERFSKLSLRDFVNIRLDAIRECIAQIRLSPRSAQSLY